MAEDYRVVINPDAAGQLRATTYKFMEQLGEMVEKEAKAIAPVDTGAYQASITHETREDGEYVGSPLPYATALEFGHSSQAPNGVLRVATDSVYAKVLGR